jgi:hypothetical protein
MILLIVIVIIITINVIDIGFDEARIYGTIFLYMMLHLQLSVIRYIIVLL